MIEKEAIKIVKDYFKNHGFFSNEIETEKNSQNKKSPDLEIRKNGEIVFYCEVKTPNLKQNPQTKMFHWSTTLSKLRNFIHTAVKQFSDFDTQHKLPWILVFTSDNFQLNWTNFCHCIQGTVAYNGQVIKDFNEARFIQETNKDLLNIELIIWFQVNPKEKRIYQIRHFVNQQSQLFLETNKISDLLNPYLNENIS